MMMEDFDGQSEYVDAAWRAKRREDGLRAIAGFVSAVLADPMILSYAVDALHAAAENEAAKSQKFENLADASCKEATK